MTKSKMSGTTIAIVVLALAVVFLGYSAMTKAPTLADVVGGDSTPGNPVVLNTASKFGDDNTGQFRPAVYNSLDTAATSYKPITMRVYQIVDGVENFYGTVTTDTGGVGARGASDTLVIAGYDENNNIYKYAAYVPASANSTASARFEFDAAEDVVREYAVPNVTYGLFKIYDEENRGYLWTDSPASAAAATSNASGVTWGDYDSADPLTVGAGGFYDYTIYFQINGSVSTYNQFEDQVLLIAVDGQSLDDWLTPDIAISGATVTELEPGEYNDKIKNLGYDWIFKVTNADGTPYHIDSTWSKIRITQYAKSGVNPDDDIEVALVTGGWFQETVGSAMKMDTHKDDAAQTEVFAEQVVVLGFA